MLIGNYLGYTLIGYYHGGGVYRHPDRPGLSIERDHLYLVGMTEDESIAWKQEQYDLAMTQRLEEERERADKIFGRCDLGRYVPRYEQPLLSRQAAEDWHAEVGKAMAQDSSDIPEMI